LKGIETSFQVVPLFLKSFHFWVSYIAHWNFLKIPSVFKGFSAQSIKIELFTQQFHFKNLIRKQNSISHLNLFIIYTKEHNNDMLKP
jgi:hypothetical protein